MKKPSLEDSFTVRVGRSCVPVKRAKYLSILTFDFCAHGKAERGDYAVWTAVFKKRIDGKGKVMGRARPVFPAGDRFHWIGHQRHTSKAKETRKAYADLWRYMGGGRNIKFIRPSTHKEVLRWLSTHKKDGKGLRRMIIGGEIVGRRKAAA